MHTTFTQLFYSMYILIRRILIIQLRQHYWILPLTICLIVFAMVPIALRGDSDKITAVISPVLWLALLMSSLLSSINLFRTSSSQLEFEQWLVAGKEASSFVLSVMIVHWLAIQVPLVLVATAILEIFDGLGNFWLSVAALSIGTGIMTCIGVLTAALSMGRSQILGAVIALPISMPALLMGNAITETPFVDALLKNPHSNSLEILGLLFVAYCLLTPAVTGLLIKGQPS